MNRIVRILLAQFYFLSLVFYPGVLNAEEDSQSVPLVRDVRVEGENVVVDLSQLLPYDIFTLSSPWRLVVEIPGAQYKANFSRKNVKTKNVRRIRGYQFKEDPLISRVVLDLTGPVDYKANAGNSQIVLSLKRNEVLAKQAAAAKAAKRRAAPVRPRHAKDLLSALPRERVTLDFEGADIRDVVRLMSETSNINMIFGPEVVGTISVHLKQVPFDEAFQTILNLKGYVATQIGSNILRVTTPDKVQQDKTQAILYTRIIPVNYLKASAMMSHLQSVMSSSGRKGTITVVEESNSLVVTDSQEGLAQARRLIAQLDQKPKQVLIESRIVEINLNNGFDIGIQWEYSNINLKLNPDTTLDRFDYVGTRGPDARVGWDGIPGFTDTIGPLTPAGPGTGVNLPGPVNSAGITFGFIKSDQMLSATLAALVTKSKARILSSPKVVTVNGEEATIEAVQDIPFRTSTVSGTGVVSNSFQNVSAGIILTVKPVINAENRVTLEIKPESSFPTQDSTEAGPIIRTRRAQTTVIIKDGETLVIGGLIDDQDTKTVSKVPILGDIPILGAFFRSQSDRKTRNELLVFVTPRIVRD